jgi:hypothetical protein
VSFDYDPEVPAGYQDADILQRQYEEEGRALAADKRRGICHHGWLLGAGHSHTDEEVLAERERAGDFPQRNRNSHLHELQAGEALCLDCGEIVPDPCP